MPERDATVVVQPHLAKPDRRGGAGLFNHLRAGADLRVEIDLAEQGRDGFLRGGAGDAGGFEIGGRDRQIPLQRRRLRQLVGLVEEQVVPLRRAVVVARQPLVDHDAGGGAEHDPARQGLPPMGGVLGAALEIAGGVERFHRQAHRFQVRRRRHLVDQLPGRQDDGDSRFATGQRRQKGAGLADPGSAFEQQGGVPFFEMLCDQDVEVFLLV